MINEVRGDGQKGEIGESLHHTKIRALVFDVDGVLIPNEDLLTRLATVPNFNVEMFNDKFFNGFGEEIAPFRESQTRSSVDVRDILSYALSGTGWEGIDSMDPVTKREAIDRFIEFWFGAQLDQGLLRELRELSERDGIHIPIYVASNQERRKAAHLRDKVGLIGPDGEIIPLGQIFGEDHMIFSVDLGVKKPDREFFEQTMERISQDFPDGIRPEEVVFFDDKEDIVSVSGRDGFGWTAVQYRSIDDFRRVREEILRQNSN